MLNWLSVLVNLTLPSVLSLLEHQTTHIRQVLLRLLDVPVSSGQVYTVAQSNLGSLLGSMLNHPHWIGIVVTTGQPGGSGQVYITTQSNLRLSISCFRNLHILLLHNYICKCHIFYSWVYQFIPLKCHCRWYVPTMPTYIFMFYTQRYYPRLYVRNIITCVGLVTIQPNFINVRKRGNQEHVIFDNI